MTSFFSISLQMLQNSRNAWFSWIWLHLLRNTLFWPKWQFFVNISQNASKQQLKCLMWSLNELDFEHSVCTNQDPVSPQYVLPKSSVARYMYLSIFHGFFSPQVWSTNEWGLWLTLQWNPCMHFITSMQTTGIQCYVRWSAAPQVL